MRSLTLTLLSALSLACGDVEYVTVDTAHEKDNFQEEIGPQDSMQTELIESPSKCIYGDPCDPVASFEYLSDNPDVLFWSQNALRRWENALCVPLAMQPGQHTIELVDDLPGTRVGQTVGPSWDECHVEILLLSPNSTSATITHEIAHVLGRTNNHSTNGVFASPKTSSWITMPDIVKVCENLACRCMRPER